MNKGYGKCIRIDNGDGSTMEVPIDRAYEKIRDNYTDPQPVFDLLHDGQPVRTTFATYQLVSSYYLINKGR